ncbi:MAG: MFS transporter [Promethearchaeota archaeon]|nr:MAG: MFS transporter [Candidatus Lokiarchaeota archaeon]
MNEKIRDNLDNHRKWHFWPVLCLTFLYPINLSVLGVSIPIYYYSKGISIEIIGFLAAAIALTYSFSPLLLNKLSERFGRKNSVVIATLGATAAQISFYFTLEPLIFIIARLAEGFIMGFYWTNLQSTISDSSEDKHSKYTAVYNLSWNLGVLSGLLFGAIVVFFVDDVLIVFYLTPLILIITCVISVFFLKDPPYVNSQNSSINQNNIKTDVSDSQNKNDFSKYFIPVMVPILVIAGYSILRGSIGFLYPIKSEMLGIETYTVYLYIFLLVVTQAIFSTLSSFLSMKWLKCLSLISLGLITPLMLIFGIVVDYNAALYIAFFLIIGIFCGILYGSALKLFIVLNVKKKTTKYSSINESLIGLFFLITPILLGFIATVDLNLGFFIMSIVFLITLVITLIFIIQIQKDSEK